MSIENLFIFFYVLFHIIPSIHGWFGSVIIVLCSCYLLVLLLFLFWLSILIWLVDLLNESFIALSIIEQLALIIGIKLVIVSELMLFFACFWTYIDFRLMGSYLLLLYFPLLSCFSFSIPFSNLLIPLFSSLPIQCSQVFIKTGFLNYSIEGVGQSLTAGFSSIIMQCKELSYSYFSLSDRLIGSIHYFTTGLHGFHVLLGPLFFFIIVFYFMFSFTQPFYFMEFSFPLFLSSHHRHFVDFIWLLVYILVIL